MIKEDLTNNLFLENDDNCKKFDSLIKAYNEKGFFPFLIETPSLKFSTKISSPTKNPNKGKLEFSSLKKDFSINNLNYTTFSGTKLPDFIYGYTNNNLFDFSEENKNAIKDGNSNNNILSKENNIIGQKRIRQKLNNEFEDLLNTKKTEEEKEKIEKNNIICQNEKEKEDNEIKDYPLTICISDDFFNLLQNIYKNEGIEIGFKEETKKNYNIQKVIYKTNNNSNNCNGNKNELSEEPISCICLKSQCLNNYCSCHKNGNICNKNCRCIECKNNHENINNNINSNYKNKNDKIICKCQNSDGFPPYCDCKKRGLFCNKNPSCINCKNNTESLKNVNN